MIWRTRQGRSWRRCGGRVDQFRQSGAIFRAILLAFTAFFIVVLPVETQTPSRLAPGCRAMPPAELIGRAEDQDYVLTETAGLNTVLVHLLGQTWLSDKSCLPDAEQGAIKVVVSYGVTSSMPLTGEAENIVFGLLDHARQDRRPSEFPPIAVSAINVNDMPGAEAISRDITASDVDVFRYALVFEFPDGAKGLLTASGPLDRLESLRPDLRRIGAGLRPRRNVREMEQALHESFDSMLLRLRGPVIDQALDICLTGESSAQAAEQRAVAARWPAFEDLEQDGEHWGRSESPANDSARIGLMLASVRSQLNPAESALQCLILGSPPLGAALRARLDARIPGTGEQRSFTIVGGQIRGAVVGVRAERGTRIGIAQISMDDRVAAIAIELIPVP
jgi:hypothetical protein